MARVHVEFDPTNPAEVTAVVELFAPKYSNDAETFEMVQQILANQQTMQGKLDAATAAINSEGETITVITDQLQQLEELEVTEKQAIADAAARVQTSLSALQTQLSAATGDDAGATALINSVQTDVANLANIAAASGVTTVPTLPADPGVPVDNPTSAPVGATPTGGDINSVTV